MTGESDAGIDWEYGRAASDAVEWLLKEGFLVNHPKYREVTSQYPLPDEDDDNQYIPSKGFLLYLRMYERIMRECHIVGGWDDPTEDVAMDDRVVNPLAEYNRRRS